MHLEMLTVLSFSKVLWKIVSRLLLIFIVAVMSSTRFRSMMLKVANLLFIFFLRNMIKLRYFQSSEFEECNPSCKIDDMDEDFLLKLDDARSICSFPFVLNSAFRPKEYELQKGRSGSSSHCKGLAVDISCLTSVCRLKMIMSLLAVGFRRIGIYPTFIHVDSDFSKPASMWYGK